MSHASPWSFEPHVITWVLVAATGIAYAVIVRRPSWVVSRTQLASFSGGLAVLFVALTWPLADIAMHWSLTGLVCQRLLLVLAAPPLLVTGLPQPAIASFTRPLVVDSLLRICRKPAIATAIVTVIAVATLSTPAVDAQASSLAVRAVCDGALLFAGFVLWMPVLTRFPGPRPSSLGRAGYLVVQSIVPSFLAVVWIFARHPLYPVFARTPPIFGVSAVLDQQLAGFVAKLATIGVLWSVAFVTLARAQRVTAVGGDPDPLLWSDVERELERIERATRRTRTGGRRHGVDDSKLPDDDHGGGMDASGI